MPQKIPKTTSRKKKVTTKKLRFPNPFRTVGKKYPRGETFVSVLPIGYSSVEGHEKELDLARQLERHNAKIYSDKEKRLRALYKAMKAKKEKKLVEKLHSYIGQNRDYQGKPIVKPEYADAITARYMELFAPESEDLDTAPSQLSDDSDDDDDDEKGTARNSPFRGIVGNGFLGPLRYNTQMMNTPARLIGNAAKTSGAGTFLFTNTQPIFRHPKHPKIKEIQRDTAEEDRNKQATAKDLRESIFQHKYLMRYGKPPSTNTITEAIPKIVEPLTIEFL